MPTSRLKRSFGTLAAVSLVACGPNWRPLTMPQPKPLGERTVIEFRVRDSTVRLHAVVVVKDSLSGIPWLAPTSCDTCRVRYAMADITNLRTGNPGASAWNLVLLPLLALLGGTILIVRGLSFSST